MSEYEVCWLTDFPLIFVWALAKISQKKANKQLSLRKNYYNFTVNKDHKYDKQVNKGGHLHLQIF